MSLSKIIQDEIDKTIDKLNNKKFATDPIAGAMFSKITSVMSSAYKRHGFILEHTILNAMIDRPEFEAWDDKDFKVSAAADSVATDFMKDDPGKAIASNLPYAPDGHRQLQIDLAAYNKNTKHVALYEIKRGSGFHDAGKKRQILRDLLCMELLAKSYGESKNLEVVSSRAHIVFYYGKCSIKPPYSLTADDFQEHFGFDLKSQVEEVNEYFKKRLFEILSV